MVKRNVKAVIMEVSSQSLKLNRVYGMHFDIGLFTNLSEDHISAKEHPDIKDYFESTLVFSIVSNNCIEDHQNIKLNNFEICTLWKLENNEWQIINSVDNQFLN